MKTIQHIIAILTIAFLTFACSNNDDEPVATQQPVSDYFLKAKVNGVQYTATAAQTNATKIGSGATTTITINSSVAGKNFKLTLVGSPAAGTFQLNADSSNGEMSYVESSLNYSTLICPDNSGTLIITAVNATSIEGTFNFVAKSSAICSDAAKTITEGSFKSKFIL
jgi:Family of unknown function (DUF6252)